MAPGKSSGVLLWIVCAAFAAWPAYGLADANSAALGAKCLTFELEQSLTAGGLQPDEFPLAVAVQSLEASGYPIVNQTFARSNTTFKGGNAIVAAALHDQRANLDTLYNLLPEHYGSFAKAKQRLTSVNIPEEFLVIQKRELNLPKIRSPRVSAVVAEAEPRTKPQPVSAQKEEREVAIPQRASPPTRLRPQARPHVYGNAYKDDEGVSEPTYRPKYTLKRLTLGAKQEWLRSAVSDLKVKGAGKGFEPNIWNLTKHSNDPQAAKVLKIAKEDYGGSLYDAYKSAGFDPDTIFQRLSGQFSKPFRIPVLAQDLRAIGSGQVEPLTKFDLEAAVVSEAPPRSRKLRSLLVQHLIDDADLNHQDVGKLASQLATRISAELSRDGSLMTRVDSVMVLTELRSLAKNRTVLEYLKVPALHYDPDEKPPAPREEINDDDE